MTVKDVLEKIRDRVRATREINARGARAGKDNEFVPPLIEGMKASGFDQIAAIIEEAEAAGVLPVEQAAVSAGQAATFHPELEWSLKRILCGEGNRVSYSDTITDLKSFLGRIKAFADEQMADPQDGDDPYLHRISAACGRALEHLGRPLI